MQIEKNEDSGASPLLASFEREATPAQERASLFPTRLALARWMHGGDVPHVHAAERTMPMRVGWYAQAQRHFQSWLDIGGFQQADLHCPECARRMEREAAGGDCSEARLAAAAPAANGNGWASKIS